MSHTHKKLQFTERCYLTIALEDCSQVDNLNCFCFVEITVTIVVPSFHTESFHTRIDKNNS